MKMIDGQEWKKTVTFERKQNKESRRQTTTNQRNSDVEKRHLADHHLP